jgi:tRNA pseudouridine55 synthase
VRAGKDVKLDPRPITIYESELLEMNPEDFQVSARFKVSSGTYIRAIARDISKILDFPLHLSGLIRTSIDRFSLEDPGIWIPGENEPKIQNPAALIPEWKGIRITGAKELDWISHGRKVIISDLPGQGENFYLLDEEGWPLAWCVSAGIDYEYRRIFV